MSKAFDKIFQQIRDDPDNTAFKKMGYDPLYVAGKGARLLVVGHAPGRQAQEKGVAWDDASGERLKAWMGIDDSIFRDPQLVALLPMDFYYQGKGKSGDKQPRKAFAPRWHPQLLDLMPDIRLTILVGNYAQGYYLGKEAKKNLTETVREAASYLPRFFPIVHPSPLNFRWLGKNPWFEQDLVPLLQQQVQEALKG